VNQTALVENRVAWTWADLLSTYRYWGLFLTFALADAATQIQYTFVYQQYRDLGFQSVGSLVGITRPICLFCTLLLAWVTIRTRPVRVLLICAVLAALALVTPHAPWISDKVAIVVVMFALPLLSNLMILVIPVSLAAGARGGIQAVLVAFGVAWVFAMLFSMAVSAGAGSLVNRIGSESVGWFIFALLLIAVVCLLPIKPELFTIDPPERGRSLTPVRRSPFVSALLCVFVPFYFLYWIYRIHGEEAGLKPSRQLLSPRAAAWITVIPVVGTLMLPFMLSTLADHHNETAAESGNPRVQRAWAVFLWTLLCPAVAVALLQSKLNRLAMQQVETLPPPTA
jgi:hypothetical protein